MLANPAGSGDASFVAQPDCSTLPRNDVPFSAEGMLAGAGAAPTSLSKSEAGRKWRLLFDGKSLDGWSGFQQSAIPRAWHVEEGALTVSKFVGDEPSPAQRGDIRTVKAFGNFELRLQWAIAPGGNSGLFFFAREGVENRVWKAAPELQILDDARHEDGVELSHRAGGVYDIQAPRCHAARPPGEYNDVRLIVKDGPRGALAQRVSSCAVRGRF